MLPLEPIFIVPSLFVTPLVLTVAFIWRRSSETYPRFWWTSVVICLLLTAWFTTEVMAAPLYSERRPSNPDAFPGGVFAVLTVFLAGTCLVIPSFSVLIGLACLSPRNLRITWRSVLFVLLMLYVVVTSMLVYNKHVRYMADYRQERAKPRRSPFERFEDRRDSPPSARQQQQLKRLQERIEQRQKQEQNQRQ
jgi:hypothetical protein